VTAAAAKPGRRWRLAHWIWPLGLLLIAWLITPLRAGATYPGMPCTAQADTVFGLASYTILIIPTAALLRPAAPGHHRTAVTARLQVVVADSSPLRQRFSRSG